MTMKLSGGALQAIMDGTNFDKPVLQVLGQKKITGSQAPDRYRLLLSDGVHSHSSAMLATQLNDLITSGRIDTNAVIRLDKYLCNTIQPDRRVVILLEVTVLATKTEVGGVIGNPTTLRSSAQQGTAQQENISSVANANQPPAVSAPMKISKPTCPPQRPPHNSAQPSAPVSTNNKPANPSRSFYGSTSAAKSYVSSAQNAPARGGNETPSKIHPISCLTPYQNRWTIKARVTQKSNIRTWSNSRGEGKLFSMAFLDDSGEIKATAFQSEVDKFYDLIEINKVYIVRKASLKTADKRYSSINNDYEMTFTSETEVIPCDDGDSLPTVSFNFVPIGQLEQHQPNSNVDVIGIVRETDDLRTIVSKQTNREVKKRDLTLVDQSQVQIRLTLWGTEAEQFCGTGHPVLAVKGCKLSDWGGRSLSSLSNSQVLINPDIPECHVLRGWYDKVGATMDYSEYKREGAASTSSAGAVWKTLDEVKAQGLGQDQADYFTVKATVVFLRKENCMYMACPQADCNKKVIDQANGYYRCEKCQKEYNGYKWRMILSANLTDFTDNQWVTCFQETAETILASTADDVGRLRETDEAAFDRVFAAAHFKSYIFRLRAKMETFNDEHRLKVVCVQATPLNPIDYNKKLLTDIERLLI